MSSKDVDSKVAGKIVGDGFTSIDIICTCTLTLKSHLPYVSVWSKTILNTGGVCGAGMDPQI